MLSKVFKANKFIPANLAAKFDKQFHVDVGYSQHIPKQQRQVIQPQYGLHNVDSAIKYRLQTNANVPSIGYAANGNMTVVTDFHFPVLKDVTAFQLELYEDSMRVPHWHDCSEIGYVVSGEIEVLIVLQDTTLERFVVKEGSAWFVPAGLTHSLNNIGKQKASMSIGFDKTRPGNYDYSMVYGSLPAVIRGAYSPDHKHLQSYVGTRWSPIVGHLPACMIDTKVNNNSAYQLAIDATEPLFMDSNLGSVHKAWADNWPILESSNNSSCQLSMIRTVLQPGTCRDAIWWPDVNVVYTLTKGHGHASLSLPWAEPAELELKHQDYLFVPQAVAHTFVNRSSDEQMEVVGFMSKHSPMPEMSILRDSKALPLHILNAGLSGYGASSYENVITELCTVGAGARIFRINN